MASAQREVTAAFPEARVVRGTFGMVVVNEADGIKLGEGRSYYEEEAWIEAAGIVYRLDTGRSIDAA